MAARHDQRKQSRSGRAVRPGSLTETPSSQSDRTAKTGRAQKAWGSSKWVESPHPPTQGSGEGHHARHTRDKLGAEVEVSHNGDEAGAADGLREGAYNLRRWRPDPPVRAIFTPRRGPRQGERPEAAARRLPTLRGYGGLALRKVR